MKITKTLIICILTGLSILALLWASRERYYRKAAEQVITQTGEAERLARPELKKIREFKDSINQNHSVFEKPENKIDGKIVAVSKSVIDTIAQLSGIDKGNITNWQQINVRTEGKLLQAQKKIDSLEQAVFFYKDKSIEISFTPKDSNGTFDYLYNAKINITDSKKGGKIFGAQIFQPKYYTDIFSDDPRMKINGYKSISIEQKQKPHGIKVDAVAKYEFQTGDASFGAGARFDLGRAMITLDNYYIPQTKSFYQEAGARFSVFK